jgi:hypothetical protein
VEGISKVTKFDIMWLLADYGAGEERGKEELARWGFIVVWGGCGSYYFVA